VSARRIPLDPAGFDWFRAQIAVVGPEAPTLAAVQLDGRPMDRPEPPAPHFALVGQPRACPRTGASVERIHPEAAWPAASRPKGSALRRLAMASDLHQSFDGSKPTYHADFELRDRSVRPPRKWRTIEAAAPRGEGSPGLRLLESPGGKRALLGLTEAF